MQISDPVDQVAFDIARDIVADLAPDDLADFDAIALHQLRPGGARPAHGVGLGIGSIGTDLCEYILPIVLASLHEIAEEAVKNTAQSAKKWLISRIGDLFRSEDARLRLSIAAIAIRARERGLPEDAAASLQAMLEARLLGPKEPSAP